MFTSLQIFKGSLRFNWGRDPMDYRELFIIRNKLTKKEYFNKICNDSMRRNGINLMREGIPRNVPLEVVSRAKGRSDISYNVANTTPYKIYYQLYEDRDGSETMEIELPGIAEDMGVFLPENLIYFDMITSDDARIRLYLPKLYPGYNCFWFTDPGYNCRVQTNYPKLDETKSVCEGDTIKGVFQLICGKPTEEERRH